MGVTNDYQRRFQEHQSDIHPDSYTYKRRPLELVYVSTFQYINQAILREKQIKRWSKAKKEMLISQNFEYLHLLAACTNGSCFWHYKIIQSQRMFYRAVLKNLFHQTMSGRA